MKRGWTLAAVFGLSLAGLALLLGCLFWLFTRGTRDAILESAEKVRQVASMRIEAEVAADLRQASEAVRGFEEALTDGPLSARFRDREAGDADLDRIEAWLFAELARRPALTELTFTCARSAGRTPDGDLRLQGPRAQVSVMRTADGAVWTRRVMGDRSFRGGERRRAPKSGLFSAPLTPLTGRVDDPADTPTFTTPASADFYGKPIWSDLHRSMLDPTEVVVTVQKTVEDGPGRFAGVLRVGLSTAALDRVTRLDMDDDRHVIFLCDRAGRLVTRIPGLPFRLVEVDEDLRWASTALPPPVQAALARVKTLDLAKGASRSVRIDQPGGWGDDEDWLVTFRGLEGTQDWVVGIAVPEAAYLGAALHQRNRMLAVGLAVMAIIVLSGLLTLRGIRRSLDLVISQAGRMAAFDFSASPSRTRLVDVQSVLDGLERAKTALRAMGKYVPVDLVAWLYGRNHDPELGGEPRDLTLMFTDLQNFTTLSERSSPAELAQTLGLYFERMAAAIHGEQGTIDKYIGDSIMAMWNAPEACPDHAIRACAGVLACIAAERELYASAAWGGRPALVTRFGVHRDNVLVGHFGAPDRLSYTSLGDGVNLASRLEGLNKVYGTRAMVSETVHEAAGDRFAFRRLDRVAVKGKQRGVEVFELLTGPREPRHDAYEQALEMFRARDFQAALGLLAPQAGVDPPSAVLARRCEEMLAAPPPAEWDGVYVATSK